MRLAPSSLLHRAGRAPLLASLIVCGCHGGAPAGGDGGADLAAPSDFAMLSDLTMPQDFAITPGDGGDDWDTFVVPRLAAAHMPGLSVAVVRGQSVVWTRAWGMANLADNVPVTTATLFSVGEVTRLVTATAVLQTVAKNGVGLDDDVDARLPFTARDPAAPNTPITWRMLLTHTASILDRSEVLAPLTVNGDSPVTLASFLPDYLTPAGAYWDPTNFLPQAQPPGTAWLQSAVGVSLAAYLVETVGADPFETVCARDIFAPLAMPDATFRVAALDEQHLATPYAWTLAGGYVASSQLGDPTFPDHALRVSAPSLAHLLVAYINGGQYGAASVLDAASVSASRTPQLPALQPDQGLLWRSQATPAGTAWGQMGQGAGIVAEAWYVPAGAGTGDGGAGGGVGLVMLLNGTLNPDAAPILDIENRLWAMAATL